MLRAQYGTLRTGALAALPHQRSVRRPLMFQRERQLDRHFNVDRLTVDRPGLERPLLGGLDRLLIQVGVEGLGDTYVAHRSIGPDDSRHLDAPRHGARLVVP